MSVEVRALFSGRVQGVGFRASVKRAADRLSLKGRAKNLVDGRVEVIAQGPKTQIDKLLQEIQKELFPGFISKVECEEFSLTNSYTRFDIL